MPAITRVRTRYGIDGIAIDSSASISSLTRMAPSCAVEPAPMVAARPMPAMTGAAMRTLMKAAKKPVSASTPMLPSELKPWTAMVPPVNSVRKPTIDDGAADHGERAGAHADLGDQADRLPSGSARSARGAARARASRTAPARRCCPPTASSRDPPHGADGTPGTPERSRRPSRHSPAVSLIPTAVTTTLTTNSAMNAKTTVSLTASPTLLAPPRTFSPR